MSMSMSDFVVAFDSRGHEIVDSVPFEPSVRLGQKPRETIEDQLRRMIMRRDMERADMIKDEADLMEDLNDFSDDPGDENLFGDSRYELSDEVPDSFSADEYRKAQASKNSKDSVSKEDSGTESSGGTE